MDESCAIQTQPLGCIKNSVAAIKTATLKKSNFLGSPQHGIMHQSFFTAICFMESF